MKYNVQIRDFCKKYLEEAKSVSSIPNGVNNRVYLVETVGGKYVFKAINPTKSKDDDIERLEASEHIGVLAKEKGASCIVAKRINDKYVNLLKGQYYVVYDFFDGETKASEKITLKNCFEMGTQLAKIHNIPFNKEDDFTSKARTFSYGAVELSHKVIWEDYMEKATKFSPDWLSDMEKKLPALYELFDYSLAPFLSFIPSDIVLSHNDLHPENVMWKDNVPYAIDWETAGFIDATFDCLHMAMRWATARVDEKRVIDKVKLYAFLEGYSKERSINVENIELAMYIIFYRRLNSLRFALISFIKNEDAKKRNRLGLHIKYSLAVIDAYLDQVNKIDVIKKYVTMLQPGQTYVKSPSYEILPRMESLVKNNNILVDKYKEASRKYVLAKEKQPQ